MIIINPNLVGRREVRCLLLVQCPIYMPQQTAHALNDIAPNRWDKMQLHELTQSMRKKRYEICKLPKQNTYNCTT